MRSSSSQEVAFLISAVLASKTPTNPASYETVLQLHLFIMVWAGKTFPYGQEFSFLQGSGMFVV
jgi:hypothetical protein